MQVTGLEPTRLMRHRHLKLALSVCGNAKHFRFHEIEDFVLWNKFRYHQIEDLVQFRYCCFLQFRHRIFKRINNKKQAVFLRLVLVQVTGLEPTRPCDH